MCVLTLASIQPGSVGDTLLLARLEKGTTPVNIRIPTALAKVRAGMGEGQPSHVRGSDHGSLPPAGPAALGAERL